MPQDYSINLKATLDTSQVRRELNSIQSSQRNASNQARGVQNQPVSQNAILNRLNASLNTLSTSIRQLSNSIRQMQSGLRQPRMATQGPASRSQAVFYPNSRLIKPSTLIEPKYNPPTRKPLTSNSPEAQIANIIDFVVEKRKYEEDYKKQVREAQENYKKQQRAYQDKLAVTRMKQQRQFGRQLLGFVGGDILNSQAELLKQSGNEGLGLGMQIGGRSLQSGAMMGFAATQMGGSALLWGGMTAAASGVIAVFEEINKHGQQLATTLQNLAESNQAGVAAFRQTLVQNAWKRDIDSGNFKRRLEESRFTNPGLRDEIIESYENAKIRRDTLEQDVLKQLSLIEYAASLKEGDILKNGSELNITAWYRDTFGNGSVGTNLEAARKELKIQLEALQQSYANAVADFNRHEEEFRQLSSYDKTRQIARESNLQSFWDARLAAQLSYKDIQNAAMIGDTNLEMQDLLANKTTSPLQKFTSISSRLDASRQAIRNIHGEIAQAYKNIQSARNLDEVRAQEAVIDDLNKKLGIQTNLESIFSNALQNIKTNMIAPDMQHLTSLSQYGYMMGESDTRAEQMENYLAKQTNLQEQINEKLREGVRTQPLYVD